MNAFLNVEESLLYFHNCCHNSQFHFSLMKLEFLNFDLLLNSSNTVAFLPSLIKIFARKLNILLK